MGRAYVGYPTYGKRSADAEADADGALLYGLPYAHNGNGYPYAHHGYYYGKGSADAEADADYGYGHLAHGYYGHPYGYGYGYYGKRSADAEADADPGVFYNAYGYGDYPYGLVAPARYGPAVLPHGGIAATNKVVGHTVAYTPAGVTHS